MGAGPRERSPLVSNCSPLSLIPLGTALLVCCCRSFLCCCCSCVCLISPVAVVVAVAVVVVNAVGISGVPYSRSVVARPNCLLEMWRSICWLRFAWHGYGSEEPRADSGECWSWHIESEKLVYTLSQDSLNIGKTIFRPDFTPHKMEQGDSKL